MKAEKGVPIKTLKVVTRLPVEADVLYDVLHDDEYRPVWDPNVVKTMSVYAPTPTCTLDYYAAKTPRPLKNRDCCFLRSWRSTQTDHVLIMQSVERSSSCKAVIALRPTSDDARCSLVTLP